MQVVKGIISMGGVLFCFMACGPATMMGAAYCQHIYESIGRERNVPVNYDAGIFESCIHESGWLMEAVMLQQHDTSAPIPPYSQCTTVSSIAGATAIGSPASFHLFGVTNSTLMICVVGCMYRDD